MRPSDLNECAVVSQISPSGHSPHHETPNTVNAILTGWLEYAGSGGAPPLCGEGEVLEMKVGGCVGWVYLRLSYLLRGTRRRSLWTDVVVHLQQSHGVFYFGS